MAKKTNRKKLKEKAWKIFSEYIRKRDADSDGYCVCVTCKKPDHWKNMQAGHAVGGRTNGILFHEQIVHAQCRGCNIFKNGNYNMYALFMIDTYGREKFEEFLALKHQVIKLTDADLQNIIETYSQKIEAMD